MNWTDADERAELARVAEAMMDPRAVFVFGSNEGGRHGAGAAAFAHRHYGAAWGIGEGLQGRSYAWPTKSVDLDTLPLTGIARYAQHLCEYAAARTDLRFVVTRVGCGLAGLTDAQMVRTLPGVVPDNVQLPPRWIELREALS